MCDVQWNVLVTFFVVIMALTVFISFYLSYPRTFFLARCTSKQVLPSWVIIASGLTSMDLSPGTTHGGRDVRASAHARRGWAGGWQNIRTGARHVCSEVALDACKRGVFVCVLAFLMPGEGCCAFGYANRVSNGSAIRLFRVPKK